MAAEPALCERCGRERAFVRVTDSAGAGVLCQCCLPLRLQERDCAVDLTRFFLLLANPRHQDVILAQEAVDPGARCPVCGLTYGELADGGILGCPACYDAFRPAILSGLQTLAG